jgi:hypothetical protein
MLQGAEALRFGDKNTSAFRLYRSNEHKVKKHSAVGYWLSAFIFIRFCAVERHEGQGESSLDFHPSLVPATQ